jgi:DNA-binding HxlR family transcriptional regulator
MKVGNRDYFDTPEIFVLKRTARKTRLREIVITAMQEMCSDPQTKSDLQKLVRIRRKTFRQLLQELVQTGVIVKIGFGVKRSPFKYQLADQYRQCPTAG